MNRMQKFLTKPENKWVIFNIVRVFHPTLPLSYIDYSGEEVNTEDKLKVHIRYGWVCVSGLDVSIGIKFPSLLTGGGWDINDFETQRRKNNFHAWRFSNDKLYEYKRYGDSGTAALEDAAHRVMLYCKVPKPTAQEMYESYYSG